MLNTAVYQSNENKLSVSYANCVHNFVPFLYRFLPLYRFLNKNGTENGTPQTLDFTGFYTLCTVVPLFLLYNIYEIKYI